MRRPLRLIVPTFLALSLATPVLAQELPTDADDWTLQSAPERKAVIAAINFTSGLSVAARCVDGVYDLLITGLPEASARATSRELGIQMGDAAEPYTSVWTVGTRRDTAFSRIPAVVARDLAKGGKFQVVVPATASSRRTRYVMDITPSSTAIEQTLTACGRPMVDPREVRAEEIDGNGQDGLPTSVVWQTVPRPTFPDSVNGRSPTEGYVVLSCVADEGGGLTECVTESEQPAGYNLGRSVERSLTRARIKLTDEAATTGRPLAGRMIRFAVNFKMEP